jgi:peptidoglycan/LPS O-acetylase OafA/YrhL
LSNFALRRVLRLGTPYWVVLLLVLALSYPSQRWFANLPLTEPISWQQLLASVSFLQDILGFGNISAGLWFVCIDLQLGLLLAVLLWLAQSLAFGRPPGSRADVLALSVCFVPLALLSLFLFGLDEAYDMWVSYFFFMPFLGVLAWWALAGRVGRWYFWSYVAVLVGGLALRWHWETATAGYDMVTPDEGVLDQPLYEVGKLAVTILTGVGIYGLGRAGHLGDWLTARWLQYLGKISYSLFLIHYPVSWAVTSIGYQLTGDRPVAAIGWLMLALLASLGAAALLYQFVEGPSLRLVRRLRLRQGGTG